MEDFLLLDNEYSEDEKFIRESVAKYVKAEVSPLILEAFESGTFPRHWIAQFAQLGLFGMTLPVEYGGSAASYVAYGLVCQELEKGDSGLRSFVSVQSSLCMYPIFRYGTESQKQKWLPLMASGEAIGCFGLTEPDSGSDPASMRTTARKVSGGWRLNGNKMWITNASIADLAIVWANTDEGFRGFIVEKDFKGFSTKEIKHKVPLRASITGELILEDVFVPDENFLPGSDKGLGAPLSCLTEARYGIAWGAIGAAMGCYETAVAYSLERRQFNKPIGSFQLVQKTLADMHTEIVKAQCLNWRLGRLKEAGKSTPTMISLAKRNACHHALEIARNARNLLGGNGISLEYSVIRHMNNLEAVYTYEGTDNIHTLVLGRHITGINAFE